ncbi:hypothetical protein ABIE64_002680 [Thalassospira sp. MBR-102]|uniref:hypothetical protein n=1 Tax=Thalassospira sp. MBR-102 TaxID=3156466 RepID=UPI0033995B47
MSKSGRYILKSDAPMVDVTHVEPIPNILGATHPVDHVAFFSRAVQTIVSRLTSFTLNIDINPPKMRIIIVAKNTIEIMTEPYTYEGLYIVRKPDDSLEVMSFERFHDRYVKAGAA